MKSSLCSEIIQRRIKKGFKVKLSEIACQAIEFQFSRMPKYSKMSSLMMYFIVSYNLSSRIVIKNKTAFPLFLFDSLSEISRYLKGIYTHSFRLLQSFVLLCSLKVIQFSN